MITLARAQKLLELSLAEYSAIRRVYYLEVYNAVKTFLNSKGNSTGFKSTVKTSMVDAFLRAAETAWIDGGSELPIEGDALDWLGARQAAELSYIDELAVRLVALRKEKDLAIDFADTEAATRAEGYCGSLDFVYSNVKLLASGSKMLTFVGVDGQEPYPCPECARYKNKRHKASWWVANDAIPGSVTGFTCKGYNCKHVLVSDDGQIWSL